MSTLSVMYRDVDRTPYLFVLRECARKIGLAVEVLRNVRSPKTGATGEEWGELLEHEEVDFLAENYWGLQSYRLRGVPFVCVATNCSKWNEKLVVGPGIRTLDDLRGKRFAQRPTGPSAVFPAMWLSDVGIEMEIVEIPEKQTGRWGQWKVVASGEYAATFMSPLYMAPALQAGLRELPFQTYPFSGGNVALTTTEHVAARKREAVQKLVDAVFMTNQIFHTDRATVERIIRDEALELLSEHFTIDDGFAARMAPMLAEELSEVPVPTPLGVYNAQRIRFPTNPELRDFNPMLMWDLSFARDTLGRRR